MMKSNITVLNQNGARNVSSQQSAVLVDRASLNFCQRNILLQQMGANRETHRQTYAESVTLEHSALTKTNPSPQGSGNPRKRRQKNQRGMEGSKKTRSYVNML